MGLGLFNVSYIKQKNFEKCLMYHWLFYKFIVLYNHKEEMKIILWLLMRWPKMQKTASSPNGEISMGKR